VLSRIFWLKILAFVSLNLLANAAYAAQETATEAPQPFSVCLKNLQEKARLAGVSEQTNNNVLGKVKFVERVISYDRNQPEFVQTFPGYISKRVTPWRVNKGRELLKKHKILLNQLTQEYGIPAKYLVSFWGLESNFGTIKGKMPIIDSLATLACDPRRSEFFTKELILALRLMEREKIPTQTMVGSWAGAMGHTQFMPSAYTNYAVDGDGDGQINLWESEQDALTSAANFLKSLGWKSGYRWGREVRLKEGFDFQLSGRDKQYPLSFWFENGVTSAQEKVQLKGALEASLLVPSGHEGPAFLTYSNFDVILRWNNSEYYAIAVGHLADRILGKGKFVQPLPALKTYAKNELKSMQETLNLLGFNVGEADGILGPATRKGVRAFQATTNMIADGFPDQEVIEALLQVAKPTVPET
jgi:membrane-bound lytic murein transglycosylase B